jgi:hypothetical protein
LSTRAWGVTPAERDLEYPCDRFVERPDEAWYRGVDVAAPVPIVYRWLCQLRLAPYSYDVIDNFGRRSPRTLTPGLDQLAIGQRVMHVFDLVAFERDRHFTAQVARVRAVFGDTAVTYMVRPGPAGGTRLLAKVVFHYPGRGVLRSALRSFYPAGDSIMMHRQLGNLRRLAERDAQATARDGTGELLPYVDEHAVTIARPAADVWSGLPEIVERAATGTGIEPIARLLGCDPATAGGPRPLALGSAVPGFRVTALEPERELRLEGRHRFSRYALVLRLDALGPREARLRAETRATFPGPHGRAYRAVVIGTRGHVLAVRRLLHAIERGMRRITPV